MIFELPNPVPYEIKDKKDIQSFFSRFKIIPQYGTIESSSLAFLDLLTTLSEMSPTFSSVYRDLSRYTFGVNPYVVTDMVPGLSSEFTELDFSQQLSYRNYLAGLGLGMKKIKRILKRIDYQLLVNSNAYLIITRSRVNGQSVYDLSVPHFSHVAYIYSEDPGEEFLLVSKYIGNLEKMVKYPPMILRATQQDDQFRWNDMGDGVEKAIVHLKMENDNGEGELYERSELIPVLNYLYADIQMSSLMSKISATELISKKLLAFQAPDPETFDEDEYSSNGEYEYDEANDMEGVKVKKRSMFERNMMTLKRLTTNLAAHPSKVNPGGNAAASFAGIEYPFSGQPPTTIDLEINRDEKYHSFTIDKATSFICGALGWAPELISVRPTKTTLGGNLLYDIFVVRNTTTILPRQATYEDMINGILGQVLAEENAPAEFEGYGLKFEDVIGTMIASLKGQSEMNAANEQIDEQIEEVNENDDADDT